MFSTANTLPPLSALTSERHHLPPISPPPQPLPTGNCRFVLLHPSVHNQRCSCQSFHHNGKPGTVCDCGHQACYHTHSHLHEGQYGVTVPRSHPIRDSTLGALLERIQNLEQALANEKRSREESLWRETQLRDGRFHLLQQTLQPFKRKELEVREKLIELEDRVEGNYDEQLRMMERLIEVDDATMTLEKRLDDHDDMPNPKRRRLARPKIERTRKTNSEPRSFGPGLDSGLTLKDAPQTEGKQPHQSPENNNVGTVVHPETNTHDSLYPRSSGILDTSKMPASHPPLFPAQSPFGIDSPPPSPRSSGVLDLRAMTSFPRPTTAGTVTTTASSSSPLFYHSLAPTYELDQVNQEVIARPQRSPGEQRLRHNGSFGQCPTADREFVSMVKHMGKERASSSTRSERSHQLTPPEDDREDETFLIVDEIVKYEQNKDKAKNGKSTVEATA